MFNAFISASSLGQECLIDFWKMALRALFKLVKGQFLTQLLLASFTATISQGNVSKKCISVNLEF